MGDSVFSTDYNGVNKKLISSNDDIIRIRVVDNKIYYVENCGEEYRIGVMNDDGSENKTIATAEEFISKMAIQNNVLYYLTDSKLFTSNLDGTDSKVLIENADTFVVGKNALYYVSNDVITEYNLKKQTFTELISGSDISNLALNAESLYYSCNKGLYCLKTDGSRSVSPIISDSDLGSYTFFDNNIYYISEYSTDELDVFAEALAEDYDVTPLTLKLVLIGTGSLYKANIDGSNAYEVEDTDDSIAFALYTSPGGLYRKFSAFSDNVEKIVF